MQSPQLYPFRRAAVFLAASIALATALTTDAAGQYTSSRNCDNLSCLGIVEAGEFPLDSGLSPSDTTNNLGNNDPDYASQSPMSPPSSSGPSGGGFGDLNLISGSSPGDSFAAALAPGTYLDNAVVSSMFRTRFDAAYNNRLPDRAEFFYAQCGCFGPPARGPLLPETSVDYQEITPYFERALSKRFSFFVESPIRFINPDVNDNTAGMGDIISGFKSALYACDGQFVTAQFKVYAPTGDADRGLGTGHASLEPGVLYLGRMSDRLVLQSEFRVWVPISDSQVQGLGNFTGPILRYGLGGGYDILDLDSRCKRRRLAATFETVGWTITDGLALDGSGAQAGGAGAQVVDVSGDTIVNLKSGLRYTAGRQSIASSYGVAVTGDKWYSDIMRVEYRYTF